MWLTGPELSKSEVLIIFDESAMPTTGIGIRASVALY